jgi:hypothetical protein
MNQGPFLSDTNVYNHRNSDIATPAARILATLNRKRGIRNVSIRRVQCAGVSKSMQRSVKVRSPAPSRLSQPQSSIVASDLNDESRIFDYLIKQKSWAHLKLVDTIQEICPYYATTKTRIPAAKVMPSDLCKTPWPKTDAECDLIINMLNSFFEESILRQRETAFMMKSLIRTWSCFWSNPLDLHGSSDVKGESNIALRCKLCVKGGVRITFILKSDGKFIVNMFRYIHKHE